MKKISILSILLSIFSQTYSQYEFDISGNKFGKSGNCHINVNDPKYYSEDKKGIISSTVKLGFYDGPCTGVLINRNTDDKNVGYYILTARHCINYPGSEPTDLTKDVGIAFNYQSSDALNSSTFQTNKGINGWQSGTFNPFNIKENKGYEYVHKTPLRLVDKFVWGDFALLEMVKPVPIHFNMTYAGWNPNRFYNGISIGTEPLVNSQYNIIHHSKGDIKKITEARTVLWLETPIATGCYTVTVIIDVLFGWIWGHQFSTQVICNYIDNPWMNIQLKSGALEKGASGSSIFNSEHRSFGIYSGGFADCGEFYQIPFFGKFHANYYNQSIKNALNPSHNLWVDLWGLPERKITCFDNLKLTGQHFPANHYQKENHLVWQSKNRLETTGELVIHEGASEKFRAKDEIVLKPGFSAVSGSRFVAEIEPCSDKKYAVSNSEQFALEKFNSIDLPEKIVFDREKYNEYAKPKIAAYPNPANQFTSLVLLNYTNKSITVKIFDLLGREVLSLVEKDVKNREHTINLTLDNLDKGQYIIKVYDENEERATKLIVTK
jgi:hypothetical protein